MPRYEYTEMAYIDHQPGIALERLNELGAQGWGPAFQVGRTLILCRELGEFAPETRKPDADVEDWREVYRTLPDDVLEGIDADDVAEVMGEDFELPTRTTLNRWAEEARESVGS
jgi:hypothetical protein